MNDHKCGVNGCDKGQGKIYTNVVARCANYNGNHHANAIRCSIRQKAEGQARRIKILKESENKVNPETNLVPTDMDINQDLNMDQEESDEWLRRSREKSSTELYSEGSDHTPEY